MICSTCHHEIFLDRHLGNHQIDMHHAPTYWAPGAYTGPCEGLGRTNRWWYAADYGSQFVDFTYPDGRREILRVWRDGRREDWTGKESLARMCGAR